MPIINKVSILFYGINRSLGSGKDVQEFGPATADLFRFNRPSTRSVAKNFVLIIKQVPILFYGIDGTFFACKNIDKILPAIAYLSADDGPDGFSKFISCMLTENQ